MPRQINFQVKLTEEERAIFESVARIKGRATSLAEYVRDELWAQYEAMDWYKEGLAVGKEGILMFPVHSKPGEKDHDDYDEGWKEGNAEYESNQ